MSSYSHYNISKIGWTSSLPSISTVDSANIVAFLFSRNYCYPSQWDVHWDGEFYLVREGEKKARERTFGLQKLERGLYVIQILAGRSRRMEQCVLGWGVPFALIC